MHLLTRYAVPYRAAAAWHCQEDYDRFSPRFVAHSKKMDAPNTPGRKISPPTMWQETLHGDVNQLALYESALQMWYHLAGDPLVNVYKKLWKITSLGKSTINGHFR